MSDKWQEPVARPAKIVDDGGPVFSGPMDRGMSLRDYFASQALVGAFQNGDTDIVDDIMAQRCYQLADAMLRRRSAVP